MIADPPTEDAVVLLVRGPRRLRCRLRWWRSRDYRIVLDGPDSALTASGPDLFEALTRLRRQLEAQGWLIAVQGARRDTYPSGMARDMGGGERVYVQYPGRKAHSDDLVDTLAPTDNLDSLATVDEQEREHLRWLESGS